jgi:hypothetical protein
LKDIQPAAAGYATIHMCAVFPRIARKNRTPTERTYRSAEGKNADRVSRGNQERTFLRLRMTIWRRSFESITYEIVKLTSSLSLLLFAPET